MLNIILWIAIYPKFVQGYPWFVFKFLKKAKLKIEDERHYYLTGTSVQVDLYILETQINLKLHIRRIVI